MPTIDHCHQQIVSALEKAGWQVAPVPPRIVTPERTGFIDIQAERGNNSNRETILLAEVKCFGDPRKATTDLYTAVGQYTIYRTMLDDLRYDIPLYLAIPERIYQHVFDRIVMKAIERANIWLMIVNLSEEKIVQWIRH